MKKDIELNTKDEESKNIQKNKKEKLKNNAKDILFICAKYILVFVILIGIYLVLLTVTSLLPSSVLEENVRESSETLLEEGEKVTYNLGYKEENIFTFTDALMINNAYSVDYRHPLESSILIRKNYIPGQTKVVYPDSQYNLGANEKYINKNTGDLYQTKELYGLMHGDNIEDSYEYARYWHGYLTVLRPLLSLFNYSGIRIVLFIATLITVIAMIVLLCRKVNVISGIIYGIGLLAISIFIVSKSINEILVFLIAFIASIILLLKKDTKKNIGIFFFIVGSVTNFIDLLTAPLVTLGLTAITYFLIIQKREEKASIKEYILDLLKIGISWTLGYGLTWVTKWIITEVVYGRPIISQAIEQALFRSDVPTYNGIELFGPIDVIKRNMDYLSIPVVMVIIAIALIYLVFIMIKNRNKKVNIIQNLKCCIPYVLIFFFPMVWYIVIKQHSYTHAFFVYRILVISILCLLIVATKIFKEEKVNK